MAKRPSAPRPRTARSAPPAEEPARRIEPARSDDEPARLASRSDDEPARTSSRSVGRPAPGGSSSAAPRDRETPAPTGEETGRGRVVQAADRFRSLVAGRPWRRRRRTIIATVASVVVLLGAALSAAIWLPALQLQQVSVSGLGYVDQEQVRSPLEARTGDSVLLLPTGAIEERLAQVPGISGAEVERRWPDGAHVTVTESVPLATLARPDGSSAIVDEHGEELPAAAGEGASLVPLTVDPASSDPDGASEAMVEVLAELPDPLRGAVTGVTAASRSDVTLTLSLEDGGTKTVVWGDAQDSGLKAEVAQALIGQPGTEIDVSSPVAPVTR